jgi:hypothetical protein
MYKTLFALLGLLLGIATPVCAQENDRDVKENTSLSAEDKVFETPPYATGIQYSIKLGHGDILRIDLANGYDLRRFRNIDSLIAVFNTDMEAFRDSLNDPLTVKHVDYLVDSSGKRKLRIRQERPAATSFLLDGPEPSILRIRQDTIHIMIVTRTQGRRSGITVDGLRYDRLCFFVNHYGEMSTMNKRGLNEEIASILSRQLVKRNVYHHPNCYIVGDSIVDTKVVGQGANRLEINAGAAVENYKNLFAPSAQVDMYIVLERMRHQYRFGLSWEPLFFFASDGRGHLRTFRNDMVVAHYEHNRHGIDPLFSLDPAFSLGYVFHREGGYFTQPSFRLTYGAAKLKGGLALEPALFFTDFFRNVTPGLRLSFGGF